MADHWNFHIYGLGGDFVPKPERRFLIEIKNPAFGNNGTRAASIAKIAITNACQFVTSQVNTALIFYSPFYPKNQNVS